MLTQLGRVTRLSRLRSAISGIYRDLPVIWPTLEEEVGDDRAFLKGKVLNAGAGCRDISHLVDGVVTNQDIQGGLHNANIDIHSPVSHVPRPDGFFDAVFCNAVLEHVVDPDQCIQEFHRVLRRGGYLYLVVPFMQPEHKDPADYTRYTRDGLRHLAEKHGFQVEKIDGLRTHTVYHTLAWIIHEWLTSTNSVGHGLARLMLYPLLRRQMRRSATYVDSVASGYKLIAVKP